MSLPFLTCFFPLLLVIYHFPAGWGGEWGGSESHRGVCEDKQSWGEENDTNQLKHYCPLLMGNYIEHRALGAIE